jgi:hypothetical protein
MEAKLELGHDTKVPSTAPQSPKQLLVLSLWLFGIEGQIVKNDKRKIEFGSCL